MFIQTHNFGQQSVIRSGFTKERHNSTDHIHQFLEMEIVLEGEIEVTLDGRRQIARRGDIAVIPPYKIHSFRTPSFVRQMIFVLSDNFIPEDISFEELCCKRQSHVFAASPALWDYIESTDFIHSGGLYDPVRDRVEILRKKATISLILSEYFSVAEPLPTQSPYNTLMKILTYIAENYCEPLSLESVGNALGYSAKYVSNCLKDISGFGFRGFINSLRIERATSLLTTTDKTVLAIAMECGFTNESHFHQVFKQSTGVSPGAYRDRFLKKLKSADQPPVQPPSNCDAP